MQIIKTGFSSILKKIRGNCLRTRTPKFAAKNINNGPAKDEFVSKAANPPREMTIQDRFNIRQYFLGKKVDLNITPEEIKTLFGYEGEIFQTKSFELLCNKMKVPKELQPKFTQNKDLNVPMSYNYVTNEININPNFTEYLSDKSTYFAKLRHEMQHYSQNISIFRHETKGNEFADILSKADTENKLDYEKFRKTIIEKYGIIKKDSAEGKRAEKMFDATISKYQYWKEDGNIDIIEYIYDLREAESLVAEDLIKYRVNAALSGNNKFCYIQKLREGQELLKKNAEKLDPQLKEAILSEQQPSLEDAKQILSYLFD